MKRILFIYCHGGGGHYANFRSFCRAAKSRNLNWQIEGHNIYDIISSNFIENVYNYLLQKGQTGIWERIVVPLFRIFYPLISWNSDRKIRKFLESLDYKPDAIIANIQVTSQRIASVLGQMDSDIPYFVFINDFGEVDHDTFRWGFNAKTTSYPTYFVCPNEQTRQSILRDGHPDERVLLQRGIGIDEAFIDLPDPDKRRQRKEDLGLTDDPVVLVMFGGVGNHRIPTIVTDLLSQVNGLQIIALCGKHQASQDQLLSLPEQRRLIVRGYVENLDYYMSVADIFIGKPGPASISEAVAMGACVLTFENTNVMIQERTTLKWLQENNLGMTVVEDSEIPHAVKQILNSNMLATARAAALKHQNFAMQDCINHVQRISQEIIATDVQDNTANNVRWA